MKKSISAWILFCFVCFFASSQEIELTVQTGHSSAINVVTFSPGDDLLASGGSDNKIILWDFLTAKQADVLIGHSGSITDLVFHPTENVLISSSLDSTVKIWNLNTCNYVAESKFNYPVFALALSPDGNYLAIAGREIRIVPFPKQMEEETQFAESGQKLPVDPKKSFSTVSFSGNGDLIGFGGSNEDFGYVVNLKEKSVIKKIAAAISDIHFDEISESVIYTTSQGIGAEISLSSKSKKSTSTDWMLNSYNAAANNTEYLFLANDLGEIQVVDRKTFQEKYILKSNRSGLNSIEISRNKHFLASAGDDGRIVIWDLGTMHAIKELKGSVTQINAIAFSRDGNEILVGYQDGSLRKTNLFSNQSLVNSPQSTSKIVSGRFSWSVYEILSFEKDSALLTMHRKRLSLDQENTYDKIEEYTVTWHFRDNYLSLLEREELHGEAAVYIADKKRGLTHPTEFLLNPDLRKATREDQSLTIACNGTNLTIQQGKSLQIKELHAQHSDRVTAVALNETYGFFATSGWDGLIRFRDLESGKLLTTFGPFSGGQFIYINPDGYYFSSKKALDYVGFKLNHKLYSFEQFDLIYNRPDLVASYLPYFDDFYVSAYKNAYLKRLNKMGLTEEDLKTDQAVPTITYSRNLDQLLTTGKIRLTITCKDELQELDRLHLRINGVPEFGRFGKEISGRLFSDSITVELNPGTNYFQIFCTNKNGVSSLKESFSIEGHKKDMSSDLYLVSIGVSDYAQSQYNLNFARKDAEDMNRFFSRQFGLFSSVYTKLLVDSSVTKSNIYSLKSFLDQPQPNDVVLFFIAGHGVLDLNLDYYLATYDMDFKNPAEKGIPYELFEELLDNTKSRKKVMFLDACHSGEIDKQEVIKSEIIESEQGDIKFRSAGVNIKNREETNSLDLAKSLFADMRLNNGTTVISSAGGTEFAIESESWKNGAFTYCLLYGLSSGDADLNKNKMITLSELQEYLLFQVSKVTQGKQTPTSRAENLNNDFRVK